MKPNANGSKKKIMTLCVASLLSTAPLWAMGEAQAAPASPAAVSAAEAQLGKAAQQTLNKLYKQFPALASATKEVISGDRDTHRIIFRKLENKKATLYCDVEINRSSGVLLSLTYENPSAPEKGPAPSADAAKQKAEAFLRDMLGSSFEQYRLDKATVDQTVTHVAYNRYVNNIRVAEDGFVVGVNGSGKVSYMNGRSPNAALNMAADAFANPAEAMAKEEAEKAMAGHMTLMYMPRGRSGVEQKTYDLMYFPGYDLYLNAKTGEVVETAMSGQRKPSPVIPVKPGGKKVLVKTPEDAAKALGQFGIDAAGATFQPSSVPPEMMNAGETEYESKQGQKKYFRVNAIAGRVVGVKATEISREPKEKKLSDQEIQKKALAFLEPYLDTEVTGLHVEKKNQRINPYEDAEVVFYRSYQGIPVPSQAYRVTVNAATGEITGLSLNTTDGTETFANASKVVSPDAAAAEYVKHRPFILQYVYPQANGKTQSTPVLVYTPENMDQGGKIDALTGAWKN
ncbi:YcdB/YcdC domain-containing protein [Brevibacillus borstelensis]|uniref:YcdB/YcdC domain-containing protein n=1 Tax=Brevibacillus borstelensis TaxID=45462 RepID=UPI0030BC8CC3